MVEAPSHHFTYDLMQPTYQDEYELNTCCFDDSSSQPYFDGFESSYSQQSFQEPIPHDPVLLDAHLGHSTPKRFDTSNFERLESDSWSVEEILASYVPETPSIWTSETSNEISSLRDAIISPGTADSSPLHYFEDLECSSLIKSENIFQSPAACFNQRPLQQFKGPSKASKGIHIISSKKRNSKVSIIVKKAAYQKLVSELQLRHAKNIRPLGILLRKNVAKELDIDIRDKCAHLTYRGRSVEYAMSYLARQTQLFHRKGFFRTIWRYKRRQDGPQITFELSLSSAREVCDNDAFQFSIVSRYLPYGCFGKPGCNFKRKSNKVQAELEREMETRGVQTHCWRHFVTSFEYFKLVSFMLGKTYDFTLNDNQTGETRGSDGKVISPEKRHDMRTRSHAKIYFEGKTVKSAHELVGDESDLLRRQFIVGTFHQIMGYTHKKPFGSDSSLSVMEFKYLQEALQKEINFHVYQVLQD